MATKRKRVSYTAELKLKIIEEAEKRGNREAARLFQVDESNVRLWRKKKSTFQQGDRKRRTNRHGHPAWPLLEDELHRWVLAQREKNIPVSTVNIRCRAGTLAREMALENFQAGSTWCYRFMKRNNLVIRNRTTVGQNLPEDWKKKEEDFLNFCKKLIEENSFTPKDVFNMDEVPLCFDSPSNRTVDVRGSNSIPINTTGHEKTAFTVVLSCAADGAKLPPMVIFKRKTLPKEAFPDGVEVRTNERGWMNEEVMLSWLQNVWRKRRGAFFKPSALLIMDAMKAHTKDSIKNTCKSVSAKLSIIPGGLTKKLQPLDLGVNRSFKSKIRMCWEKWMTEGQHTYAKQGKMRRASYAEVCKWVKHAWDDYYDHKLIS